MSRIQAQLKRHEVHRHSRTRQTAHLTLGSTFKCGVTAEIQPSKQALKRQEVNTVANATNHCFFSQISDLDQSGRVRCAITLLADRYAEKIIVPEIKSKPQVSASHCQQFGQQIVLKGYHLYTT